MENIHKEYQGKVPIFYFDSDVSASKNIKEFQLLLEKEVRNDFKNILIDLSNLRFISDDFVFSLNKLAYSYRKNGGRIGIIIPFQFQNSESNQLIANSSIEVFDNKYEAVYNFFV